ncbi:MAG: hypothetical protein H6Q59_3488 [Firmicutes bacterium]|nr:hypothetical protein [Bacillota bacterium]
MDMVKSGSPTLKVYVQARCTNIKCLSRANPYVYSKYKTGYKKC